MMSMPTLFGQDITSGFILGAYTVSIGTACLVLLLELLLWDEEWKQQFAQPNIRELYWSGVRTSLLNYLLLAPAAKGLATAWVASQAAYNNAAVGLAGLLACQAVGYGFAHAWMHLPDNYRWTGHKFHHRFNDKTFVRPISANAVTWIEFAAAYAIPLMAGILLFRPTPLVADLVILSVSLANLCIHTPEKVLSMRGAPALLVTNKKHFHHHQVDAAKFFSAPILDLDSVLGLRDRVNPRHQSDVQKDEKGGGRWHGNGGNSNDG